ncbi:hypothetical protein FOZ60_000003 [Perkinsus olseni]|uniref:Uncharacterized protein n=1 Tax=Perkinsus olseni TaxID=32597 RepID=A0A7J6PQ01_PEROL|nr:hypothetical protein FOZ60_000003 [Perkinsus olseni]KAF4714103.1 hypothetical protein FOZ62_032114 [Perkinsus olseni]
MDLQRYHHAATSSEGRSRTYRLCGLLKSRPDGADQTSATERQLRLLMAKEMVRRREVEQARDRLMNKIATEMATEMTTEMTTEMALEMAARKASEMAVVVASEIPWVGGGLWTSDAQALEKQYSTLRNRYSAQALELARAETEIDELTRKLKKYKRRARDNSTGFWSIFSRWLWPA